MSTPHRPAVLSFLGRSPLSFVHAPWRTGLVGGIIERRSVPRDARGEPIGPLPPKPADLVVHIEERGLGESALGDLHRFEETLQPLASSLSLSRCAADDAGNFVVSVHRTDRPGPRPAVGDVFFAGAQFSGHVGSGLVLVEPHLLRQVCVNGATVFVRGDVPAYVRWSESETEGDLDSIVETGFSPALTRLVELDLRRAMVVPSPRLADLRSQGFLRMNEGTAAAITVAARSEAPTLFGFYNAMTAVARELPDLRAALALERAAGRLLSVLIRSHRGEQVEAAAAGPV